MTHLWVKEELPAGNVTYRRTFGILRVPPTLTHSAALSSAFRAVRSACSGLTLSKPRHLSRGVEGLTHHSDAILTSKRIFNSFLGIWVVKPDFINPETVFMPSGG